MILNELSHLSGMSRTEGSLTGVRMNTDKPRERREEKLNMSCKTRDPSSHKQISFFHWQTKLQFRHFSVILIIDSQDYDFQLNYLKVISK